MAKTPDGKTKVAIIGSGNIGTDLMIKIMRLSKVLEMGAFVGIDPESDGLKRAERMGVPKRSSTSYSAKYLASRNRTCSSRT